jgi:hypothetical protein
LLKEAQRLLVPQTEKAPAAQSEWERVRGKWVQRRLYRTTEMAGYNGWTHLRQAWLVRAVHRQDDGKETTEDRYFVTNLPIGRLSAAQSLGVVRGHWSIENDCNWTLDMQQGEDDGALCTAGTAPLALGIVRLLCYNLHQLLRRRHLRKAKERNNPLLPKDLLPFRSLYEACREALRLLQGPCVTGV